MTELLKKCSVGFGIFVAEGVGPKQCPGREEKLGHVHLDQDHVPTKLFFSVISSLLGNGQVDGVDEDFVSIFVLF